MRAAYHAGSALEAEAALTGQAARRDQAGDGPDGSHGFEVRRTQESRYRHRRLLDRKPTMSPPATFDEFSEPSLLEVELETDDDQAAQTIDTAEVLGDPEGVAQEALSAWVGPGERAWAAQALVALRPQGLLENDELDHARRAVLLSSSRSCAGPC